MSRRKIQFTVAGCLLALLMLWLTHGSTLSTPSSSTSAPLPQTRAQRKLATVKLWLGPRVLVAEMARTPLEMATGLMFRTNLPPQEAMLFIFPEPQRVSFYMRNTLIPLSCAYIDSEGTILEIHDMRPGDETPILSSSGNIQYVLEVNQGWFEKEHIGSGKVVRTEKGMLPDLLRSGGGDF
jgi:uncharacterized membrane protein (UPF0127 family)